MFLIYFNEIAQCDFHKYMDFNKASILETPTDAVDLSDILDFGGPSEIAATKIQTGKNIVVKYAPDLQI